MRQLILAVACMALAAACSDDGGQQLHDAPPSPVDAAVTDAAPLPCFSGTPTTHEQIINACTTAQQVVKPNKPPLLRSDGSLPPLP